MIWNRFDDAHDDLRNDIFDIESKTEKLLTKLKKAEFSYELYVEPKSQAESEPRRWYEDSQRGEMALSRYGSCLSA